MPTRAKMTIISLYNYDNTVFDGLTVPAGNEDEGIPAAVKAVAIAKILIDCAEFELMYPDLDFMKMAITNFSMINRQKWDKLYFTEYVKYDPIANVDSNETETHNLKYARDLNYTINDTGKYSGFNSSTMRDVTNQNAANRDAGYTDDTGTIKKERHGNIGVTSTQQLIQSEREVADFSIYQVIADDFKKAFCCLVY